MRHEPKVLQAIQTVWRWLDALVDCRAWRAGDGMNQPADLSRCAARYFAAMSVYCLLFAELFAHGSWRAGMIGASVAYACAVLHLVMLRREARDEV